MARTRQIYFLETEETSSPIGTSDAQGQHLPASPMDQDGEMIINATPSGEVQMRVTGQIHNSDELRGQIDQCFGRVQVASHGRYPTLVVVNVM